MKKAKGSKTYVVSVLRAGWMNYPEFGYKQYLTQETVNKITQELEGLKPLLDHVDSGNDIYKSNGQKQIIGLCVKSYNINEPFNRGGKKFRFEDYSACEIMIDDIEAINKIDKQNYLPSIHFQRDIEIVKEVNNQMDYIVYNDGRKARLYNFKTENIAFVENPRFDTEVQLQKDNLTDEDKGIIQPYPTPQVVNFYNPNCINAKCMFNKKQIKNSMEGVSFDEKLAGLEERLSSKMEEMFSKILALAGEGEEVSETSEEEVINETPALQEVETEEVKEEVKPMEEEVKNQETSASLTKEEVAKMIEEAVKRALQSGEVKNACEESVKNTETEMQDKKDIINSAPVVKKAQSFLQFANTNPIKEAVMQKPNTTQVANKMVTSGGFVLV